MIYDIIIIGAGPAGLTAANNTAHRGLKTLVLEARAHGGGQPYYVYPKKVILDHPGFPHGITGQELSQRLWEQAEHSGAEIHMNEEVMALEDQVETKKVITHKTSYIGKRVIVCTGMLNVPRKLPILKGCKSTNLIHNVKDPEIYANKRVLVIGGGDSALDNALMLADTANSTTIAAREYMWKAKESSVKLAESKSVKMCLNTELQKIYTEGEQITKVKLLNTKTNKSSTIKIDVLVVSIGFIATSKLIEDWGIEMYRSGAVVINRKMETSIRDIFAAGDITGEVKVIAVACAQGIEAAVNTFNSIKKPYWLHGKKK